MRIHSLMKKNIALAAIVFLGVTLNSCITHGDVMRGKDYNGYIWESTDPFVYYNCSSSSPIINSEYFNFGEATKEELRESYFNLRIEDATYRCDLEILVAFTGWKSGSRASFDLVSAYDEHFDANSYGKFLLRGSIYLYDYLDDKNIYTKELKLVSDSGYFIDKYKEEGKEFPYSTMYVHGRYVG